jgi:hypothetical protein
MPIPHRTQLRDKLRRKNRPGVIMLSSTKAKEVDLRCARIEPRMSTETQSEEKEIYEC